MSSNIAIKGLINRGKRLMCITPGSENTILYSFLKFGMSFLQEGILACWARGVSQVVFKYPQLHKVIFTGITLLTCHIAAKTT